MVEQEPVGDGGVCVWTGKIEEACRTCERLVGVPGGETQRKCRLIALGVPRGRRTSQAFTAGEGGLGNDGCVSHRRFQSIEGVENGPPRKDKTGVLGRLTVGRGGGGRKEKRSGKGGDGGGDGDTACLQPPYRLLNIRGCI